MHSGQPHDRESSNPSVTSAQEEKTALGRPALWGCGLCHQTCEHSGMFWEPECIPESLEESPCGMHVPQLRQDT